jgi:hypothetical protein
MIPDATLVVVGVNHLIDRQLGAQTKNIEQEDARFGPLSARFEPGDDHPANALGEEVAWPQRFVRRWARLTVEGLRHG